MGNQRKYYYCIWREQIKQKKSSSQVHGIWESDVSMPFASTSFCLVILGS